MTYHYNSYSSYQTYEFTAFSEADLLKAGDHNLSCGDKFVMPGHATVCITVKDNDKALSGDCWDNATDKYGQWAKIDAGGTEVGNGGQIYAESYYWVSDQYGNWYVMVEIEQEGTNADYFTFYTGGHYQMPPAGAHLTVRSQCDVSGDWMKYEDLGSGDCAPPTGSISGTVFCDIGCDGINGQTTIIPGCDYTIEAESMGDCNFKTVEGAQASGGKLAKLYCAGSDGKLFTDFHGKDGTYNVKIRVQDECDGQSKLKLYVNGQYVDMVVLNRNGDGGGHDDGGFSEFVIEGVDIKKGDKIELRAWSDGHEFVRIDNIVLEGQDREVITSEPTKAGVAIKLLDLDGNVIAETTTDANGNYKFDNVPVGDYKIMGVAPDGTEFTIKDVDGNTKDDIDSDVDENGMSGVISVKKGEDSDVDLGVCEKDEEPGSLSGRYFCDTNDNDQDDNNGDEPAVAGVQVSLFDAAGNLAVDFDGNPVAPVFTDTNGNYSFGNLAAGFYTVVFDDINGVTAGKELIAANVGDDASDSDAIGNNVLSTIENIEVIAGQDTPDNDAGVEKINAEPRIEPDAGKGCADELIIVDFSDNYDDPDGDAVGITMIGGLNIADGETVIVDGVEITLDGDQFIFNGETELGYLDIGQQETRSYEVKVEDSNGGFATTSIDVTFCGDANSVASFCASLPNGLVEYQISTSSIEFPIGTEGFDLKFGNTGDSRFDNVIFEEAYCLSLFDPANGTESFDTAPVLTANMFCIDEAPAGLFNANQISVANGLNAADNMDLVSWILNQDFENNGFTGWEVQRAIWELTDNVDTDYLDAIDPAFGDDDNVDFLVAEAIANGEGFQAGVGDIVGVVVDPSPTTAANSQPFIVAMAFEDYDCLC